MQAGIGALVVDRKSGDMKLEGTKPEDTNGVKIASRLANAPFDNRIRAASQASGVRRHMRDKLRNKWYEARIKRKEKKKNRNRSKRASNIQDTERMADSEELGRQQAAQVD